MLPSLYLIGGPTASGKTALALEIAAQQPSLIINADSMQVYRGLPLLTAQPSPEEKAAVPHELFEVLPPSFRCSVGRWREMALEALTKAQEKKLTPIIVGGTGLYFKALEDGLAAIPDIPPPIREESVSLYQELGHDGFRKALAALDPKAAARIEQNDSQRLIRAYEVARYAGKPLSSWQEETKQTDGITARYNITRHILIPERDELYARCDARFLTMIERGALEEVKDLMAQNLDPTLPAMKILGVRELAAYLRGEYSLEEAIAKAQQYTRNYAKRQMTWFRNQMM